MNKTTVKFLLLVGLMASIIVGIGEYLLHYLSGGPGGEVSMLEHVPLSRASKGHFFAVFGAPFYVAGYYGLKEYFKPVNSILANLLFALGVLAFFIGGIWISSRYFGAEVFQRTADKADFEFFLKSYEDHYQVLVWALRVLVVGISITYIALILKNKIGIPKWYAAFNPIVLLIIVISSLVWFKPLGVHIAPIAMNVVHFIFFGMILLQLNKRST